MPLLVALFLLFLHQQLIDLYVPVIVLRKTLVRLGLFLFSFVLWFIKVKVDDEVAHFLLFLGVQV